jgi:hypothetical protein
MQDRIHLTRHEDEIRYVMLDELEILMTCQVRYIIGAAGDEIIHGNHLVPFVYQAVR